MGLRIGIGNQELGFGIRLGLGLWIVIGDWDGGDIGDLNWELGLGSRLGSGIGDWGLGIGIVD